MTVSTGDFNSYVVPRHVRRRREQRRDAIVREYGWRQGPERVLCPKLAVEVRFIVGQCQLNSRQPQPGFPDAKERNQDQCQQSRPNLHVISFAKYDDRIDAKSTAIKMPER
jgi:hypothetical protein